MMGFNSNNAAANTSADFIRKKSASQAQDLMRIHGLDRATAEAIMSRIWQQAWGDIFKLIGSYGKGSWQSLSFSDRSAVCTEIIRGLLDEKTLTGFFAGSKKSLI